ncbi:MAG: hypothetical protein JKY58_15470, partial [Pseudomonas sp.]|nr:hypothetical protein [Pseudomonas sp.]
MFVAIRHHLQSAVLPTRAGLVVVCGVLMSWSVSGLAAEDERSVLALSEALARVLQSSPELAVFPYEIRAAEARILQAGVRPNPTVSAEVENVLGSGEASGIG